ncbi:unnamed protein product [Adineta ricciae]|uniref:GRIP domain-containing protein n=1 Tax=Adineta ricciae TaxID=249248 RepID=A0A814A621_ADIRI|nr:unnamed protein product [Adineta ricciae]
MFKNLKDKLATQVNKTNQTLFSTILPTDSASSSSTTSHDENNRSRIDSASSDISQTQIGNTSYVSPTRQFVPPSDVDSEYGADESDHETHTKAQKLLNIYKNKFSQLKNAYNEVEREKDNLKSVLQQQQDNAIKRQSELRQKMKQELQMKEQTESIYLNEIKAREKTVEELTQQLSERNKTIRELEEDVKNLHEKNMQREKLLLQCKEKINIHQEKQNDLIVERDNLRTQLDEKDAYILSLTKEDHTAKFNGLQQIYDELLIKFNELSEINQQLQDKHHNEEPNPVEHTVDIDAIVTNLKRDYESELNKKIDELQGKQQEAIDKLEKTHKEQLTEVESLLKRTQQKSDDLSLQNIEQQKEIDRLQQSLNEQNTKLTQYENELQAKTAHIAELEQTTTSNLQDDIEKQLLEKQTELLQLRTTIDELTNTITKQKELLEQKDGEIDTFKQTLSNQESLYQSLTNEHQQTMEDRNRYRSLVDEVQQQLALQKSQLNEQETTLSNELKRSEDKTRELQSQCESRQSEIASLQSELASLVDTNEENTRRIDEFENEKFNLEQEIIEKDRQLDELNEKTVELESDLKQAQESGAKLRKALQKMKESVANKEQSNVQDTEQQLKKTVEEYEQRLRIQEKEYDSKLKAMAKEMNRQIEEREANYHQQLSDLKRKNQQIEQEDVSKWEQKVSDAEERALNAEREMSKLHEQLKEKQLEHYRATQDLQVQIHKLQKQLPQTADGSTQTIIEAENDLHSFLSAPTEVDYLKQIVLAYMIGKDQLTMAKVICAVLRYTDDEKSLILEHERHRHSSWLNSIKT